MAKRYENNVNIIIEADTPEQAAAGLNALLKTVLDTGSDILVRDQFGQPIKPSPAKLSGWNYLPDRIKEVSS